VSDEVGRQRRAESILLATTLIWGATFSIAKYLVDAGVDAMALVAWRFGLAAPLFLLLFARRVTFRPSRTTLAHGAILGALLYVGFGLQTVGLGITSSSRSGFITALYVVFTPLLQIIVIRRVPGINVLVGIVLVLLGLWGLTAPGGELAGLIDPWRAGGFNAGDLLTLASAFFFAIYIVLLDRFTARSDAAMLTAVQLVTVALIAVGHVAVAVAAGTTSGALTIPATAPAWAGILYLALLATVLSTYWQTRYQGDTTPSRAAVIFTLESLFAAIIAAALLGETMTTLSIIGGALIITGLLVVELGGMLRRTAQATAD
jgi:drug/metabolite transporter (DMT)-like permease